MAERKTTTKKTAVKKPTTRGPKTTPVTPEQVAERAYHLWLEGSTDPLANWLTAERELAAA